MSNSPQEILGNYQKALGTEFGEVYFHALNEWCELWVIWNQFESLFGHCEERVDLMNKAGGGFFYFVDKLFFQSVLLAVCRISDHPESQGKPNLSLRLFQNFMDTDRQKADMKTLLEKLKSGTEFARDWRNRHIAHNDLKLRLGRAQQLENATRKSVKDAIESAHKVLAYVSVEFLQTDLSNEVVPELNDEMVMLHRLYLGVEKFESDMHGFQDSDRLLEATPKWLANSE